MARILLFFYGGEEADLIQCPQRIADNIHKYQRSFDKWLSDPNNNHGYWTTDSEGDPALCFDGQAFLEWLNACELSAEDEKAFFVKRSYVPTDAERSLPKIYF